MTTPKPRPSRPTLVAQVPELELPPLALEFQQAEEVRRAERVRSYDAIAAHRAHWLDKNAYYAREVRRVVSGLVVPGHRVLEIGSGLGDLLAAVRPSEGVGIDISPGMIALARSRHPELEFVCADIERDPIDADPFDYAILSDSIGSLDDVQVALEKVRPLLKPNGKLIITYYNFLWEPVLDLATRFGRRTPWPDQNWLSQRDISNLMHLAGFEFVRQGTDVLVPFGVPGVGALLNRLGGKVPGLKHGSLLLYAVGRPLPVPEAPAQASVSVICPCRNEKGNIEAAIQRTPLMGGKTELIFVDGNSSDGTVEEIERCIREYKGPLELKLILQGDGKGKGDAVRKGFAAAKCDVLMILDSDLTVPPEDLPKFHRALVTGRGDFINGVRLVYPMEGEAMRFLNLLGNKFFSSALSWVLEQPIKDSLCGTKVLWRRDYEQIAAHRAFFGDFDPFGDFDLLFGAARLNLRIVDLPVRYRARTYGDTKISRFTHGLLLFKMTAFGLRKLRLEDSQGR
ncbi:MAG: Methyltransferase type 12 [Myxococcaceae bacterium]|nr:Methyltransferase type 12 [Myxococcaceae bacterium]